MVILLSYCFCILLLLCRVMVGWMVAGLVVWLNEPCLKKLQGMHSGQRVEMWNQGLYPPDEAK